MAALVVFKLPHLQYPFYWDESWVYAPAVKLMYAHGPSLLPTALDPEYSRGHPLLFNALFALWMKVFGPSHYSMHVCGLFVTVVLLWVVYECCLRLFGFKAASIATLILAVNVPFVVQAAFVLPDMLISLFTLLALFTWARRQYWWCVLWLTALFYTKESGMVAGVVLGIDAGISLFRASVSLRERLKKCIAVALPFALIAVFFILQKQALGWYLNPGHLHAINLDPGSTMYWLRRSIHFFSIAEHASWVLWPVVALSVVVTLRQRRVAYLLPAAMATIIFLLGFTWEFPEGPYILLLLLFGAGGFLCLRAVGVPLARPGHDGRFLILGWAYLLGHIYFASVNFFEPRYLFPALVIFCIVVGVVAAHLLRQLPATVFYLFLPVVAIIGVVGYATEHSDGSKQVFARMRVQQQVVSYFEKNIPFSAPIGTNAYLQQIHLASPLTGFLSTDSCFPHSVLGITPASRYIIFDNIEPDPLYNQYTTGDSFLLLQRFSVDSAWAEVYLRR